jgi:uncharacterized membrane protein
MPIKYIAVKKRTNLILHIGFALTIIGFLLTAFTLPAQNHSSRPQQEVKK